MLEKESKNTMDKNIIAEVSKSLGVKLGEEFKLKENGWTIGIVYRLTDEGLCFREEYTNVWIGPIDIENLLPVGKYEIVKLSWRLKDGRTFFYPSVSLKKVCASYWKSYDTFCCALKAAGMVYKTKEEAEKNLAEDYKKLTGRDFDVDVKE